VDEGDLWYDSTTKQYKGKTNHIVTLGTASTPGIIAGLKASPGAIAAGDVVYLTGYDGTDVLIEEADADAAGQMPAIGIAMEVITAGADGDVITFGLLEDVLDTSGYSAGDGLYVDTTSGGLTNVKPTGDASEIQRIATVLSVANPGDVFVAGALRTNDEENLPAGYIFIGDSNGNVDEVSMTGDVTMTVSGTMNLEIDTIAELQTQIADATLVDTDDDVTWTGTHEFSSTVTIDDGMLELPNDTVLPGGNCTEGTIFVDTDATSGQQIYVCEGTAWVVQSAASSVAYDDIGNPDADSTIAFAAYSNTWTAGALDADFWKIDQTGNAGAFDLVEFAADDADVDSLLRIDNEGNLTIADGLEFETSGGASSVLTDAIDASDPGIVNAINIGSNTITGTAFEIAGAKVKLTFEDFILGDDGTILMGPDNGGVAIAIAPTAADGFIVIAVPPPSGCKSIIPSALKSKSSKSIITFSPSIS